MSVRKYPRVVDEFGTVAKLAQGFSIARFGDGELKMATGSGYVREMPNRRMEAELMHILQHPHPQCLVGIWNYDPKGPKFHNMLRHLKRFKSVLSPEVEYYSSFITRPDSAPWIRTREYAKTVESIWKGKRVAVVCEHKGSIARTIRLSARVAHIECPREGAYGVIDQLEADVVHSGCEVAVLSAGPTATVLAHRLAAAHGIQAIDFGSGGKFIQELLT